MNQLTGKHRLTPKTQSVANLLSAQPRLASYGSVREVAENANVSIGTVTRTAQSLGFTGWPALQEELRAIYISSLSTTEIAEHRNHGQEQPAYAWLTRDRDNLNNFIRSVDIDQITRTARLIARSKRTFIVAIGSFNGIGSIFAHSAWLHGYDVRVITDEAAIINTASMLSPDDLMITIGFWRLYETTYQVIQTCHELDVPTVMLTENVTHDVQELCEECIRIPAEAVGFSPSLTTVTSLVHAIIAELIAIDPEYSRRNLELTESRWAQFKLLHPY